MVAHATAETHALTDYEAAEVERIAAWKSEHPPVIGELFRLAAQPLGELAERIIPDSLARDAINWTYDTAEATAWRQEIARRAGVKDVAELHDQPLDVCDRLAHRIGHRSELIAAAEGAVTGAGGMISTILDIPLLFGIALRTIMRIGHCYGYALERKTDRAYVLGIMVAALSNTRERKQHLLVRLREIEHLLLEEAQENLVTEEAASLLFQLEIFDAIPGVGVISGALLNYATLTRVERSARHVFQERWLRDHGKVDHIAPAADIRRAPVSGDWAGILGRAAYGTSYYLGFGAALPFYAVAALVPKDNALVRGARDGAAAASAGVNRLFGRMQRAAAEPALT